MALAYEPVLTRAPMATAAHSICRLEEKRAPELRLCLGTMHRVTGRDLRMLTRELRARAEMEPRAWLELEALLRRGRLLAYLSWREGGETVHVGVLQIDGAGVERALTVRGGHVYSITDRRRLQQLVDTMLFDLLDQPIYDALCRHGLHTLADDPSAEAERMVVSLTQAAAESVLEYGMTPAEAADFVVRLLVGEDAEVTRR